MALVLQNTFFDPERQEPCFFSLIGEGKNITVHAMQLGENQIYRILIP
jgi:hypothetical protein